VTAVVDPGLEAAGEERELGPDGLAEAGVDAFFAGSGEGADDEFSGAAGREGEEEMVEEGEE
jgi:hypothetical protein